MGARWCEDCIAACEVFPENRCALCQRLLGEGEHNCPRSEPLTWVLAWGHHAGPLQQAVHHLKYKRDVSLGDKLAQHLVGLLSSVELGNVCVVPVPLWPGRKRQRGYNQAALLARPLAYSLGMPYCSNMVARIRNTASQVGLSIPKRQENMAGAFQAAPAKAAGKRVLLVDDVLTTGATLHAAAQALRQAGAQEVVAVVLARAVRHVPQASQT